MTSISTSIPAFLPRRQSELHRLAMADSLAKLASGQRVNRAADSPAGVIAATHAQAALAELQAQMDMGQRVHNQAAVAEGALAEISTLLTDASALAAANASDAGLSQAEKDANQLQIDSILTSVDRITSATSFAGNKLLDGSATLSAFGQSLALGSTTTSALGATQVDGESRTLADAATGSPLDSASGNAAGARQVIDAALDQVSTLRGRVGAFQRYVVGVQSRNLQTASEGLSTTFSAIADTDYAAEVARFVRAQLLVQTTSAIVGLSQPRTGLLINLVA
jgi:flagellin